MFPVNPFPITITALYLSLLGLLMLFLAGCVVIMRVRRDTLVGDDGTPLFKAVVRAHANLTEYAPIALLLLLVAELNGLHGMFLHVLGGLFTLARLAHAYGMIRAEGQLHAARFIGTLLSWIIITVLALTNLLYATYILK